jgi:hypothetical protein
MFHPAAIQTLVAMNSHPSYGGGGVPLVFPLLILTGLAVFGIWLWSLIHCMTSRRLSDTNRLIGILIILLLGPLGSLVYLFLPREN